MIYQGHFYDIDNNKYTVKITTDKNTASTKSITLGAAPFVSEIEGDDNVYTPMKCGLATVRILTDDYAFDVYTGFPQKNKIELLDSNNNIKWIGYATPNLYTQGYENEEEVIEIEAMDGLASLKYIDYTPISGKKNIVSFRDLIDHLVKACGVYTNYYISNATQYSSTSNYSLIQNIYISEQNFFDEDDEPMKMKEVLEQVCLYLGVTAVADGDTVHFIDYDAIKNGEYGVYNYKLDGNTVLTTKTSTKAINGDDYVENGATLSLSEVYSKATVNCSLYSFDSVIPSVWDEANLTNYGGKWGYVEVKDEINGAIKDPENGNQSILHKCFFKYLKNSNFQSTYYDKNLRNIGTPPTMDYLRTQQYVGATICKACFKKVSNWNQGVADVNFTDYILMHNHDTNPVGAFNLDEDNGLPVFETKVSSINPALFGGEKMYLVIKGSILFMDRETDMYIIQGYGNKKDNFNPDRLWLKCKLQFGNKFWNGSAWTETETCFKLPFSDNGSTEHCINVNFPIKNTINWESGITENGYAIPIPDDNVIADKPILTLYQPHRIDPSYRCDAVWLSDFDVVAVVANAEKLNRKDTDETDTVYSNVINANYVNEAKEVSLKICTWDNKDPNYSCVGFKRNTDYFTFLDKVYNKGTKQTLILEEQIIYRMVNQYKVPNVILELSLKNNIPIYSVLTDKHLSGKKFIVDSYTIDWEMNKAEIKIIEKQ